MVIVTAVALEWILLVQSVVDTISSATGDRKNKAHFCLVSQVHRHPKKFEPEYSSRGNLVAFDELKGWITLNDPHSWQFKVSRSRQLPSACADVRKVATGNRIPLVTRLTS